MFIAVEHDIHAPQGFKACFEAAFPLPDDIRLHQFLPAGDLSRAVCLLEAPSIDRLRAWHDEDLHLSEASTQSYFKVAEGEAVGLPQHQLAGEAHHG